MARALSARALNSENRAFAGTTGVSQGCRVLGFVPGFLDRTTGTMYVSCFRDGTPAPIHLLDGLPDHLVVERTPLGRVTAVCECVVAGFIRDGIFYTREQVACLS